MVEWIINDFTRVINEPLGQPTACPAVKIYFVSLDFESDFDGHI